MSLATRIRRYGHTHQPFIFLNRLRHSVLESLGDDDALDRRVISLEPAQRTQGDVLFSYISSPFFRPPGESIPSTHTHYWESLQIAQSFLDLGYGVDVISWRNDWFQPEKPYRAFVDVRYNMERLAPLLSRDCVRIMHAETAHCLFHNAAEARRLLELQGRKGVTLRARRLMEPNWAIEHADCATILGNAFTLGTYRYANKPLYPVPISAPALYPSPEGKDFDAARKRFLWLSSGGMVHKGLDLVLDAFADMPGYEVVICGPVDREADFVAAYEHALYRSPNVRTLNWVDVTSQAFIELMSSCVGLIYPSCSEGQSGAVVTCLHGGLVPIVSRESGVDVDRFGTVLESCSLEEIKDAVRMVASLPVRELRERARGAWEYARAHHTREKFAEEYRQAVSRILSQPRQSSPA